MSQESFIYGFIEGSTWTTEEYRKLQLRNIEVIEGLPKQFDRYPGVCRGMFSWPSQEPMEGGWRAQVIHFGGSFKNIDHGYTEIRNWLTEFERLLCDLYWLQAVAHIHTELLGVLTFSYDPTDEIIKTYRSDLPSPTKKWLRSFFLDNSEAEFDP